MYTSAYSIWKLQRAQCHMNKEDTDTKMHVLFDFKSSSNADVTPSLWYYLKLKCKVCHATWDLPVNVSDKLLQLTR